MENRSYRYTAYGSKRRRLDPDWREMIPSTAVPSVDHDNRNTGLFGFFMKLFAPVKSLFQPPVKAVQADETRSSSSSSLSSAHVSRTAANGRTQRDRRKRSGESKRGETDEVIVVEDEDIQILSSSIPSKGLHSEVGNVRCVMGSRKSMEKETKQLKNEVGVNTSMRSSYTSAALPSAPTQATRNGVSRQSSLLDETLKYESPSPQPEHSVSQQASPLGLSADFDNQVDRWQRRRTSSSAREMLLLSRFSPYRISSPNLLNISNKERRFGREASIIDKEGKERYRKFLEEAGILKTGPAVSQHHERRPSVRKTNYLELLQRGQSALYSISLNSGSSSRSISRKGSDVTSSSSDVVILQDAGNKSCKAAERISRVFEARKQSGSRSSSEDVHVVWDAKHRDDFNALWEEEKSTKLLAEHRLAVHRDQASLRHRRAEELQIEKRLIEEARRDELLSLEEQLRKKLTLTGYVFRPRKIKKDEFPELDDEGALLVKRVWNRKLPQDEKISGEITRKDLLTLKGLDWLNDEVINFYMNLICERARNDENLPKVYAFNTFFYPTLSSKGYTSVRRWTRRVDIFSYELLLVPVHLGAHWCLAVVDFANKVIDYYDSMGGSNDRCLDELSEYLCEESLDKKNKAFDLSEWQLITRDDIPQQMNGSDCGMFACKFAEYASRRAQISFNQQHMPYFRERMVYEICRQMLL